MEFHLTDMEQDNIMYEHRLTWIFPLRLIALLALGLLAAGAARADIFGVPRAGIVATIHQQPVEADTLRVTLSGMTRFVVAKKGERRRKKGELDELVISLWSLEPRVLERDQKLYDASFMFNETRGKGGDAYVKIGKGDIIRLQPHRRGWSLPDQWINLPPEGRFYISVYAHESDCLRRTGCSRGNKGHYMVEMRLPPMPRPAPRSCGRSNTFRIGLLDGRYQVIGMRDVNIAEKGSVVLYPVQGTICITAAR